MRCHRCGKKFFRPSEHDSDVCEDLAMERLLGCPECGTETAVHEHWCQYAEDGIEPDDEDDEPDDSAF